VGTTELLTLIPTLAIAAVMVVLAFEPVRIEWIGRRDTRRRPHPRKI
jgi:hypothetical protein